MFPEVMFSAVRVGNTSTLKENYICHPLKMERYYKNILAGNKHAQPPDFMCQTRVH
jgi:hypothetical protein